MATTLQPAAGESTKQLVNYRADGGVAVIEMFDPPANTYTYEMNRQLDEAILKARMDNDVYVILLTGSGDKFFSAGANIKMLASVDPTFKYYFCLHANEMLLRLEHTPKLVIAAINGHCVGGGLEIAMAADLRIARQDAGKIDLPEVNLGVLPGTGGTQRLSRLVGKSKAIELMITGNTFSFEEALEFGIVNDIFERDGFMENIMEYARQFTPPNKAAKAVGRIKRAVQTGWEIPMESALAVERENQQILFQSDDAKEGLAAYVEKGPAVFKLKWRCLCQAKLQKSDPSVTGKGCSTTGAKTLASTRRTLKPSISTRSMARSIPTKSSSALTKAGANGKTCVRFPRSKCAMR